MKKLLVILTLVVAMTAFAGSASVSLGGSTLFEVKLDKDGLHTNMFMWDQWAAFGVDAGNVSVSLDFDGNLTLNGISLSNDHFAADWYSSMAFQGDYSKWWFVEVDDGAWEPTAIFELKDLGLSVATQEGDKVLAKFAVDPVNVAAQISLDASGFAGAAAEVSSENVFAGLGFRVGFKTGGDYTVNAWYKNAFGPVDVDAYMRYSNFNGQYVGIIGHYTHDLGKIGAKVEYDIENSEPLFAARFDGTYEFDPVTLTVRVGSGSYADWDAIYWEEFHGDLTAAATDVSVRGIVSVGLPLGIDGILAAPTLTVQADYYLGDGSMQIPVSISSKLYDLLSVKAGVDLLDLTGWYAYVGYYAAF
ncbi:hypothetical protein [Kosmotoga olearia]|uniref:Uncharacterized protein n=1 Tax=Kosmotoga olearia (strain ATCC BAA-1733 / DSM 21960 / TBF 19.5.1) TaxID=521045 RepID=C5CEF2_KOSOT|nr:hypothetical protein [Kosmotoga olearia]ACR80192.1 hypothetical protein Kole_1501 [Kosmotoga olearia TBF 19.5.1]